MNKPKSTENGLLIVISAPSGCGKTTIVERLLKRHPDWERSVSFTTREPRIGEKHGRDYFFVSLSEFQTAQKKDTFIETAKVFDHYYATPKTFLEDRLKEGKNVILAIDVQGMHQLKKAFDRRANMVSVFILPPSVKILRERLEGRKTDSTEEIERRMEIAQQEIKEAQFYDHTVVNQNLDQTVHEIEEIIENFQKRRRQESDVLRSP